MRNLPRNVSATCHSCIRRRVPAFSTVYNQIEYVNDVFSFSLTRYVSCLLRSYVRHTAHYLTCKFAMKPYIKHSKNNIQCNMKSLHYLYYRTSYTTCYTMSNMHHLSCHLRAYMHVYMFTNAEAYVYVCVQMPKTC